MLYLHCKTNCPIDDETETDGKRRDADEHILGS